MTLAGESFDVAGGGIAGLAVATALAKRGAEVTVYEQAAEIGEVGAGLQISPNGLRVIDALGLGEALRDIAVKAARIGLFDVTGRPIVGRSLVGRGMAPGYLFVHRARLIEVLKAGAEAAGVSIRTGFKCDPLNRTNPEHFLIGADGLHSVTRAALNGDTLPFFTGQVAWRALLPDSNAEPLVEVHLGPGRHLVSYPLHGGLRNIVAVEERAGWTAEGWHQPDDPDRLRDAFGQFGSRVRGWLDNIDDVHVWGLFRHLVAAKWYDSDKAILGDAAHPTLPFLAQGANLALEDAWVLAARLDSGAQRSEALARYQSDRRGRAQRVIAAANGNANAFHLRNPIIRGGAHLGLRLLDRIAPGAAFRRFDWVYRYDATALP